MDIRSPVRIEVVAMTLRYLSVNAVQLRGAAHTICQKAAAKFPPQQCNKVLEKDAFILEYRLNQSLEFST